MSTYKGKKPEKTEQKSSDRLEQVTLHPEDRAAAVPETFADFVAVVRRLRRECPWDREQTHESVKHLLIEEAYETVDAIESGDMEELKKELGDLLLHVIFHSTMAEESGAFTLEDVMRTEAEKLIRRHPHVFGDVKVKDVQEVLANWEQIKVQERGEETPTRKSVLSGVPKSLPALLQAYRIQEKAAGVGFDFPEQEEAWKKVEEELAEFREDIQSGKSVDDLEEEFGDVLFALVNYARLLGINPEMALRKANEKFIRRFQHIESRLEDSGRRPSEVSLQEMDTLWEEAKRQERTSQE